MYTVQQTQEFQDWLDDLRDLRAQLRIVARLRQAEAGNLGDWKSVSGALAEMRVDVGAGYRLYFTRRAGVLIVMLAGGNKASQKRDIARALRMLSELEMDDD
jgi:putative addiction module killer protein